MKLFSLLTVGLMSFCALGFTQNKAFKPNASHSRSHTKSVSLQFVPTSDVPLTAGQSIPLDSIVSISPKYFSLSSDGTLIKIKKKGNYDTSYFLLLTNRVALNPTPVMVMLEFSKNGKSNWRVLSQQMVTPNVGFYSSVPEFTVANPGYLRLTIGTISSTQPLVLAGNQPDVTMVVTRAT